MAEDWSYPGALRTTTHVFANPYYRGGMRAQQATISANAAVSGVIILRRGMERQKRRVPCRMGRM